MSTIEITTKNAHTPSLKDAFFIWAKIGVLSFGGPAAQISLMHRVIVDEKKWLSEQQYLNALNFCMLLPGPEAMQLATYAGWRLHGLIGGLIAGLLFILPGAGVVLALSMVYAFFGNVSLVSAVFLGVKAAVIIIVIEALMRVAKRALKGAEHWIIAGLTFVGLFLFALPYPLIILLAASYGFFFSRKSNDEHRIASDIQISLIQTVQTIFMWLVIWWAPLLLLSLIGETDILQKIYIFFSKLAVVTFGGAYAVLAYMGQDVVQNFGWLETGEMIDGLGLAETTPGPLILVTEFVGFLAAFKDGGIWYGLAGAIVALWVTFVPCFLWIFAGAPYIEWISSQPRLKGALSAITAAVVGVILNLSIWFGFHVFFAEINLYNIGVLKFTMPVFSTLDWKPTLLSGLCAFLMFRLHWQIWQVLIASSGIGVLMTLISF